MDNIPSLGLIRDVKGIEMTSDDLMAKVPSRVQS